MKNVLVTGANGFVGSALCPALAARGYRVTGAVRTRGQNSGHARTIACGDIDGATNWRDHLQGIDVVVHLAARAQLDDSDVAHYALRRINVDGAAHLARQSAAAGVQRFVFVSSIKVNGETTHKHAFRAGDAPAPQDAYAVSKRDAEQRLWGVAAGTGLELVSIRPPLVYGPGVAGNFLRMLRLVDRGLPLPLARVDNRRSLVATDNLVDFLVQCVHHPAAAGRTLLVSDGEDLSTPQLLRLIAAAMNRRPRLWPAPLSILRMMARATGHGGTWQRLCGSLAVDIGASCDALVWWPKVRVEEAVSRCVEWYLATGGGARP
ncbi:MAG: NAD-dependent epimerase/dehydratase family protein [Gammaproteobacteria bacterium]|nr:NAD-dependent epimerase/dehydratase family protein [Gammaproteobacteria bacterium]